MPEPYNYAIQAQDPAQGMLNALKFGQVYQQGQQDRQINAQTIQQNQLKLQDQQRQEEERLAFDAAIKAYHSKENPGSADINAVIKSSPLLMRESLAKK